MSKIYIISGKQELTNMINKCPQHETNISLTLVKKYHKYEPFLDFFPSVLSNIIFEYINDVFELFVTISPEPLIMCVISQFHFYGNIELNYETIILNFDVAIYEFSNVLHYGVAVTRLHSAIQKYNYIVAIRHRCLINYFLNTHYDYNLKINEVICPKVNNNILKNINNLKHYKNEIIIVQKICKIFDSCNIY